MALDMATPAAAAAVGWSFGRVRVQAPARLHLGFLDPAASLGRPYGSLGVVVDAMHTVVEAGRAEADRFESCAGGESALWRARGYVETLRRATGCRLPLRLRLRSATPAHAGLGSGTQLALAVGRAFCTAFGHGLSTPELAAVLGRGMRSGVGVAGFDRGGLLLDGGPRADGRPAALLARVALPEAWRILLVVDPGAEGLSGAAEKAALSGLPSLPRAAAAEICHETLMRILPGAASGEFAPFAAGVCRVQQVLGEHFAPAQGGEPFASDAVARLLHWIGARTLAGTGQSSWGPTGFAFLPTEAQARALVEDAAAAGVIDPALQVHIVRARDHGALVSASRAEE